ncbi:MAG: hypothetical protein WC975_16070 [Phycisphaerae bacterium]
MALDETMLNATGADGISRFRFYYWPQPTISLGYFQDYDNFLSQFPHCSNFAIVRRLTGGGAILHDKEITYCLTISSAQEIYKAGPIAAYTLVHQAIADVLKKIGIDLQLRPKSSDYSRIRSEPEFCFARPCPTDLICSSGKLVGSAQRRLPQALMQHGSIILENRFSDQPSASIGDLHPSPPACVELEKMIVNELATKLQMTITEREFNESELALTRQIAAKYASNQWTINRKAI